MDLENLFTKIITYSFYLLFFVIPLAFSPVSFELFEYPKMMLVYGLTAIIMCSWLGKIIVKTEVKIQRTPLDIPIFLYFGSCIISTILSIDRHTSLWGYYSRSHGGLMSTISYILLYYAFVSNMKENCFKSKKSKKQYNNKTLNCIYILLFSSFLVAGYGILERLGIDKNYWIQDVQNRVFSTLGQPNWLGAMLCAIIFVPLGFLLKQWNNETMKQYKWTILLIVYFLCLIFTNSKSAILAFWVCFPLFITLSALKNKKLLKSLLLVFFFSLLIYLFAGAKTYSYIKNTSIWLKTFTVGEEEKPISETIGKPEKPFISKSSEIRKVVWKGAINIWKHYPVFGSGVETFGYTYYNFRPQEHNLLSEWDFLYNKAHNEFLNILACQGTIGIITYLFLIGSFLWWSAHFIQNDTELRNSFHFITLSLIIGYLSILITNFFGFSVVIIGILFFLIPAFCFNLSDKCKGRAFRYLLLPVKPDVKAGPLDALRGWQEAGIIILALGLLTIQYSLIKLWRADFYFAKSQKYYKSNYLLTSLPDLQKAIQLNSSEALYHAYLAKTSAKLAVAYYETASDSAEATKSAKISSELAELAENEINTAIILNSSHLNFHKNMAEVYIFLSYLDPSFKQKAIDTLIYAVKLAPTDAKILYNLSLLYEKEELFEKAIEALEKAIALKPNYIKVYLQLIKLYEKTEQPEKAVKTAEFFLENIDPENKEAIEMLKNP